MTDESNGAVEIETGKTGTVTPQDSRGSRRLFHAGSGVVILGLDWLLFSGNIASGGLATLPTMLIGFVLGGAGTVLAQRVGAGDSMGKSLAKGLAAGLLVGVPTPVAGTAVGSAILAFSGLSSLTRKSGSDKS